MDELWRTLHGPALDYAGRLLGALVILGAGWVVIHFLMGPLGRGLARTRIEPSVISFLVNSVRSALLVVVLLGVLHQLGVQTASLLTLLGAAGLAVALSLQNSLANFASGLLLLSFRIVRVGDLIEVGETRGRVASMLPFHIVLVTVDNQQITVPNMLLTSGPVKNHSSLPVRRAQWSVPLTPQDDLAAVKEALRARLQGDARILTDPPPHIYVQELGPDKRTLTVTAWTPTPDYPDVQQDLLEELGARVERLRSERLPPAAHRGE